ncbi:hypothetical protein [Pseudomonas folii]|uniref:HEPN domain-containing protein n=1 Tax=Pseudomonas folii TaxID=2762593 RepID=A0ABR7AVS8_9PSED|nr:hypothetical protein [Pseudomonas folii]MBC3949012.1 hypothetical protein [Pseudomonas folii]
MAIEANWKPLSTYFEYICSFHHLDMNLRTNSARQEYHDTWMRKYHALVGTWNDYETAIWSVRARQSLKLCFSATNFALESKKAEKEGVMAAAYYLGYYSALHAMWSVIYLNPQQTTKNVYDISHSKMLNVFYSTYAHSHNSIIHADAKKKVENLRFLREYYSYRMPLNSPFENDEELKSSITSLGGFVKQCIQLANLHSHLLTKVAWKQTKSSSRIPYNLSSKFKDEYCSINGKQHISKKDIILEPADKAALSEYLKLGCDIMPLNFAFDHMFDEYMTYYSNDRPEYDVIAKTRNLVGRAFIK